MNIARRLKVSAETLLGITVLTMIIVAGRVISLGDRTGVQLFLSAILIVIFMWLGWIQPKAAGIGLVLLGLFVITIFGKLAPNPEAWKLLGVPLLIAGLLFFGAGWNFQQPT